MRRAEAGFYLSCIRSTLVPPSLVSIVTLLVENGWRFVVRARPVRKDSSCGTSKRESSRARRDPKNANQHSKKSGHGKLNQGKVLCVIGKAHNMEAIDGMHFQGAT